MTVARGEGKAWARERFRGFENLLIPSFDASLRELDERALRLDVRQSVRHGFCASRCALDAGLTPAEKRRMIAVAADEAGGAIGIGLTLCEASLEACIDLLAHAEAAGATHALLELPLDLRPESQEEVFAFGRAVAESTALGICLPVSVRSAFRHLHPSGVPFDAYERLADLDNVVAMQIEGTDAGLVLECCERFGDRLLVTSVHLGMLPMLVQAFGVEWSGAWAVEALQSPEKPYAVQLLELLSLRRFDDAMHTYWQLAPALGVMQRLLAPAALTGAYHWPTLKFFQWLSGGNGGMTRQPCMRLYERDMNAIRAGLAVIGIECADPNEAFFSGRNGRRAGRGTACA